MLEDCALFDREQQTLRFILLRAQCVKTGPTKNGEQGHALHTIHMRMARIIHVHVRARFLAGKLQYIRSYTVYINNGWPPLYYLRRSGPTGVH